MKSFILLQRINKTIVKHLLKKVTSLKIRNREKMINKKMRGRKGVSEMLSYVLLISLGLFMAVALYSSLKLIANVKPVASCDEGTSLSIIEYQCSADSFLLTL